MMDKQQVYLEMDAHLHQDKKPSDYLSQVISKRYFDTYPFTMLSGLIRIEQSPLHHPEGDVWNHTLMVVDHAAGRRALSNEPGVLMWSALLHDLGKVPATKIRKGRITAYDHDKYGEELAVRFLKEFTDEQSLIAKVAAMVRWHMQILFVVKELPFANVKGMLDQVPLHEIALLSLCDRLGRGGMDEDKIREEEENVRVFVEKCRAWEKRQSL